MGEFLERLGQIHSRSPVRSGTHSPRCCRREDPRGQTQWRSPAYAAGPRTPWRVPGGTCWRCATLGLAPASLAAVVAELDAYTPECWHTSRAAVVRVVASDVRLAEEQQQERAFAKGS